MWWGGSYMDDGDRKLLAANLEHMQLRGMAPSTIWRRAEVIGWVADFVGCPLLEASAKQLRAWRATLTVAGDSVAVYVSHVTQFYRWALDEGLIGGSPAAGLPAPRRTRRLPRPASEEDMLTALVAPPPRIRPWLVLAGWAGLRAKEIALLRRQHVLDTRQPPVILVEVRSTKGREERIIPMSAFVLAELRPVLPRQGWVFRRHDGKPGPNTPSLVSHLANDYLHELGLAITLHQLRHRFATQAYQLTGRDLRAVQELLGHRTAKATEGYTAYDAAGAAKAVEAIPVPGWLRAVS